MPKLPHITGADIGLTRYLLLLGVFVAWDSVFAGVMWKVMMIGYAGWR